MSRPVYLHAGAHRTGTSSFQLCLAQNRAALARAGYGVAYPGRDGVPGGRLKLRLPGPRHGAGQMARIEAIARAALAEVAPEPDRALILSEENIPGRMFHFYSGQFFPASAARLRVLAQALGAPPVHLIYVLRPYAALYASAYRKRAEDNAVAPFAEIVPHLLAIDRGWPDLLAEMRDILAPARFSVVAYENRGQSRDLLRLLVPELATVDLTEPDRVVNLSASDAALAILQGKYRAGEKPDRAEWRRIIEAHRNDPHSGEFAPYTEDQRARLDARYARDLDRVAGMAGITVIPGRD